MSQKSHKYISQAYQLLTILAVGGIVYFASTVFVQVSNRTNLSGQLIICGNGTVDFGEICDDGNTNDGDGCNSSCEEEFDYDCSGAPSVCTSICGSGNRAGNEACDDGNTANGDGCSNTCTIEDDYTCAGNAPDVCFRCGNGIKENSEACDDGNSNSGDGCSNTCTVENAYSCTGQPSVCTSTCGNGTINSGEACDDANTVSGDGCSAACVQESGYVCSGSPSTCVNQCGNGQINFGEECDNGPSNSNSAPNACRTNCKNPVCGDGGVDTGEQCDDGNLVSDDGCSSTCTSESAVCGNGFVDPNEECDSGIFNSDTEIDACRTDCRAARCGDTVIDTGEGCDDGNNSNTDACLNSCTRPTCGDGYVYSGVETCEPPNTPNLCSSVCGPWLTGGGGGGNNSSTTSGNSSSSQSKVYTEDKETPRFGCGNSIFEPDLGEECDDGRNNGGTNCSTTCTVLNCGDGIVSPLIGEECEPAPFADRDGGIYYQIPACGRFCVPPGETGFGAAEYCKYREILACENEVEQEVLTDYCGNGITEVGEQCDSGGVCQGGTYDQTLWLDAAGATACAEGGGMPSGVSGDGCSSTCEQEICGDGIVQPRGKDGINNTPDDEMCDNGKVCQTTGEDCLSDNDCSGSQVCVYNIFVEEACNARCKLDECQYSYELELPALNPDLQQLRLTVTNAAGISAIDTAFFSIGDAVTVNTEAETTNFTASLLAQFVSKPALTTELTTDLSHYLTGRDTKAILTCNVLDADGNRICNLPASAFKLELNGKPVPEVEFKEVQSGFCGDGVRQKNEECDDGNKIADDACSNQCASQRLAAPVQNQIDDDLILPPAQVCPNGIVEAPEECDDDNSINGDGCSVSCQIEERCGDGKKTAPEECDDGNNVNGDGCTSSCSAEEIEIESVIACGNAIIEGNEECDSGQNNKNEADACRTSCKAPVCGDGIIDTLEECDSGDSNSDAPNACRTTCLVATCGDGIIDIGEECDGGENCSTICTILAQSICGNGTKEADEQCDDGNFFGGDGCSSMCKSELFTPVQHCGNGIVEGIEQCDDGNLIDTDTCNNDCETNKAVGLTVTPKKRNTQNINLGQRPAAQPTTTYQSPITQIPLAMLQPIASPVYQVAQTGPGMAGLFAAGVSAGISFVRRKRKPSNK